MLYKFHAPAGPVIVGARERDESDHARLSAILEKFLTSKITLSVDGNITMESSLQDRLNASRSLLQEVNTTRKWGSEHMSPLQREFTAFKETHRKRLQAQCIVSSAQVTSEICRLWREHKEERRKAAGMHAESDATMHDTPDTGVGGEEARRRAREQWDQAEAAMPAAPAAAAPSATPAAAPGTTTPATAAPAAAAADAPAAGAPAAAPAAGAPGAAPGAEAEAELDMMAADEDEANMMDVDQSGASPTAASPPPPTPIASPSPPAQPTAPPPAPPPPAPPQAPTVEAAHDGLVDGSAVGTLAYSVWPNRKGKQMPGLKDSRKRLFVEETGTHELMRRRGIFHAELRFMAKRHRDAEEIRLVFLRTNVIAKRTYESEHFEIEELDDEHYVGVLSGEWLRALRDEPDHSQVGSEYRLLIDPSLSYDRGWAMQSFDNADAPNAALYHEILDIIVHAHKNDSSWQGLSIYDCRKKAHALLTGGTARTNTAEFSGELRISAEPASRRLC